MKRIKKILQKILNFIKFLFKSRKELVVNSAYTFEPKKRMTIKEWLKSKGYTHSPKYIPV